MNMLKVIVVEDEINLLNLLVFFLKNNEHYEVIGAYTNSEEALSNIPNLQPDIIFLDIEMPRINGIELANRLKNDACQFVFTTAYQQYALEALKLGASEYLLKPITPESIEAITPKLLKRDCMLKNFQQSSTPAKKFKIQCCGSFYAMTATGQTVKWPTRKVEELFAYLLVHSECIINKWRLAEDLWPNKGMNNIYNSVYLLNKTFKEHSFPLAVVNINEGYKLEIEQSALIEIDLIQFNQTDFNNLSSPALLSLVNHFSSRGPIFNDKDYSWITIYREQYNVKHQKLLNDLLEYYKTKDTIIYNGLLKDYKNIYDVY